MDQTLGIIHQAWSNAGHKIRGTGHDFHRTTIFSLLKREMSKIKIKFLNSSFYFSLKFPDSFWSSRIPHVDDDQPLQKHDQLLWPAICTQFCPNYSKNEKNKRLYRHYEKCDNAMNIITLSVLYNDWLIVKFLLDHTLGDAGEPLNHFKSCTDGK